MQRNRQGQDLPSLPPFIAVLNQEIFLGSKDYSEETLIFSMNMAQTPLHRRLNGSLGIRMEKLHYTWQQRMVAMKLHGCFLLMVLLLKPKRKMESHHYTWQFGTQSVEDRSTVKTLLEYNADCSTEDNIAEAEGGILFVDEAYQLIPSQKEEEKDYGIEALEEIMSVMDSGKFSHMCWLK
ncbi:PROTEIN CFXQ-like protein [Salix viminalis]|uniref:PROTEIN CFXQ-like protein n=1 Tax=Salix viminalis TaxID=40686 RepID=A0A9Q0V851_SALVM|nr:PROTEIN CFXQ-like protein [Salix viminalis]